jgi:hypothetical protein
VTVGSVIDSGAPRDSPFPIFLVRARDQTVISVQRPKNYDRARVARCSSSMSLIARSFPSGGYLHDRKQKTKADSATPPFFIVQAVNGRRLPFLIGVLQPLEPLQHGELY